MLALGYKKSQKILLYAPYNGFNPRCLGRVSIFYIALLHLAPLFPSDASFRFAQEGLIEFLCFLSCSPLMKLGFSVTLAWHHGAAHFRYIPSGGVFRLVLYKKGHVHLFRHLFNDQRLPEWMFQSVILGDSWYHHAQHKTRKSPVYWNEPLT